MRRVLLGIGALLVVVGSLTSCSTTAVTSARLNAAVGPAFARLYAQQQQALGNTVLTQPDRTARCSRTNVGSPYRGAGDDWVCVLNLPYADGHVQPVNYDLKVAPTGCYTAAGPAQLVGPQTERTADGATATNPLFEFDGCFAT